MRIDCHVHIVGPPDRYPQLPDRTYLAGVAALDTLKRNGAARGISRFVIVQPSFYGTDHSATLDALSKLGDDGRGIAVIDPAMTATETLTEYRRRGIRGLRINLYSPVKTPGVASLEAGFAAIADVARSMNWHIQVIAPLPILLRNADLLAQSPVPVVIDHYGLYGGAQPGDADGQRLLGLLGHPHVWVKLSAPYRFAGGPLCTIPDRDWLHAILERAPSRSVWGSDWPHPPAHDTHQGANIATPYRALSYAALVDDFIAMLPSAAFADAVMRDNPARLYDF